MTAQRASGQMVSVVRDAKGWTQEELADHAGVSQGFLSKVENGLLPLEGERLAAVAAALEVPPDLLSAGEQFRGLEVSCLHHRRRGSRMTVSTVRRIEGLTHLCRLSVDGLMRDHGRTAELTLPRLDVDAYESPGEIARMVRAAWRLPSGRLDSVIGLLERLGVVVLHRDLDTDAQDAVSTWPPGQNPVILVNAGLPPDRERFTLLHELGHLVMHRLPCPDQETQANRFAGELLAPQELIGPNLAGLTVRDFSRLAELKLAWGISMAALIQRAKDLDCISENQFKTLRIRLNQYGWSRREPGDLPSETPCLLPGVIDQRLDADGDDEADLAADALMLPDPFRRHYLTHRTTAPAHPTR